MICCHGNPHRRAVRPDAYPTFLNLHPEFDVNDIAGTIRPAWMLDHGDSDGVGWMIWDRRFEYFGKPLPPAIGRREVRNYPAMLDMARNGEGIAIGSIGLEDDLVIKGELVRLGPPVARPNHGYYLFYSKD